MGKWQTTALDRRGQAAAADGAAAGSAQAEEGRAAEKRAKWKETAARHGSELGDGRRLDEPAGDGGAAVPSGFADAVLDLAGFCGRNGTERRSGRDQDCSAC